MTEMIPEIAALVPQQPPMRLLDRVLAWSASGLDAEVVLNAESPFADGAGVPAWIGLEYLGQAAAAFFTLQAGAGAVPHAGMLVACRRYRCDLPGFALGSTLTVRVSLASAVHARLVKFDGEIRIAEARIAVGDLSVYLNPAEDV